MRSNARQDLRTFLNLLRDNRNANAQDRRRLMRILRDEDMQVEFAKRVKERFGINIDNLRALLELLVEYAPQLLKLVAEVIAMFS